MYSSSAWEAQTRELISRIDHDMQELQADTARKLAVMNRKKAALEESLVTFREMMYMEDKAGSEVLTPEDIRDKSQKDILSLIASRNNGLLVANQAIKMMKEAGIFGNPDNASSAVYSVLKRATKEFERVGQGVYKLRDWSDTTTPSKQNVMPEPESRPVSIADSETEEPEDVKPQTSVQTSPASDTSEEPGVVSGIPVESQPLEDEPPAISPEPGEKTSSWIDNIEPDAVMLMPETIARRYNAIPVSLAGNTLVVAMANPYDIYAIEAFTTYCHKHITPVAAAVDEIRQAIEIYYRLWASEV